MFIIKNAAEKFFAGHAVEEDGHIESFWVAAQNDRDVQVFTRKDAAEKAADFFGGEVVKFK